MGEGKDKKNGVDNNNGNGLGEGKANLRSLAEEMVK